MAGLLEGKVAVITGGATGIGLATAKKLVAERAYVFILGRPKAELDAALKEIGGHVTAVQGDVTRLSDLDRLYSTVRAEKGKLDIVFVNAAVAETGSLEQVAEEHTLSAHDRTATSRAPQPRPHGQKPTPTPRQSHRGVGAQTRSGA